ncbi:hypothetical protein KSS87_012927 [Heliosperma pusillum]|nr:hypothetical protein KSS87_012927 [Heliosperma pusillum]
MSEERNAGAGTSTGAGGEPPSAAARVASSCVKDGDRVRFTVDLRVGETTIVSWKKLMKDASKAEGEGRAPSSSAVVSASVVAPAEVPVAAIPTLQARIAPGQPDANPNEDAPAPHRFSAVIEKIERLYMGKDSSDEEDLNDIPDDDQYDTEDSFIDDAELDEYFQVDKSKTKHDGYFVNRGTLEKVIEPPEPTNQQLPKGKRKEMIKGAGNIDDGQRPSKHMKTSKRTTVQSLAAEKRVLPTSDGLSGVKSEETKFQNHQKIVADSKPLLDPSLRIHHEDACGNGDRVESKHKSNSLINSFEESKLVIQQNDRSTIRESIDLNLPDTKHSIQPVKNSAMHKKEGSSVKSKVNVLEKAIRELEKMVAESRPPAPDAQDGDSSSQSVKRRLPREIKQKLAKVARLSHASNDMVSKELLSRLMGIVGHLCQVRTLKRHLKVMVTTSLSAKQEKDDKFQLIKKEVVEMVKARVPFLLSKATEQQSGGSGDLQESGHLEKLAKGQHCMDPTLEDKICDLYDTFVDGLDEDVAPQVRKLYAELAELWPKGVMDNHGIKRAICRAKERKRTLNEKNKDQEKIRRRKVVSNSGDTVRLESNIAAQSQYVDPNPSVLSQHNCFSTSFGSGTVIMPASATPAFTSSENVIYPDQPKQDKVKGTHNSSLSDARIVNGFHTGVKKKKKRAESLVGEDHMRPEKLSSHQHKHPAESHQGGPHNSSSIGFRFEPLV